MPFFERDFKTPVFSGLVKFNTGLFIDGKWVDGSEGKTIDVTDPSTGTVIAQIAEGTKADVDTAVRAAQKAFDTTWGLNTPGSQRGKLLMRLADLIEENLDILSALEAIDNGKGFEVARGFDVIDSAGVLRYYGGWADKVHGKTIETGPHKFCYTLHEPIGVVGQIIPWNFPLFMAAWKLGPALACGNTVILKPSELTPLSALYLTVLISKAGFPPGVVNIVNGYGATVGAAISEHMDIGKVAFTGSTIVGRQIMKAAASTNLKKVTLELGGKSPNIIFDDADIDEAIKWAADGTFGNMGQVCCAGTRLFVQETIHDEFVNRLIAHSKTLKVGNPFERDAYHGAQISHLQRTRIMSYIDGGKQAGATAVLGGNVIAGDGFFVEPTIFTNVDPSMKIAQEEIFGPVVVVQKFKDEEDVIKMANDTLYGLAAGVSSQNITRALTVANRLKAGTVWVNHYGKLHTQVPFGGYRQSGIGRELGEYALEHYTEVKAVQVNLTGKFA